MEQNMEQVLLSKNILKTKKQTTYRRNKSFRSEKRINVNQNTKKPKHSKQTINSTA